MFLTAAMPATSTASPTAFASLDEQARPSPATPAQQVGEEPVTLRLVGSHTQATAAKGIAAGGGSDAVTIAPLLGRPAAREAGLPPAGLVGRDAGHGMDEVNAAYAHGGRMRGCLLIDSPSQNAER